MYILLLPGVDAQLIGESVHGLCTAQEAGCVSVTLRKILMRETHSLSRKSER